MIYAELLQDRLTTTHLNSLERHDWTLYIVQILQIHRSGLTVRNIEFTVVDLKGCWMNKR